MNSQQFRAVVESWLEENQDEIDYYDFWYEPDYWLKEPAIMKAEVVTVECVDHVSGGEDKFAGGEGPVYTVFKVTTDGVVQYFKRTGTYRSFDGTTWDNDGEFVEVKPTEKVVVVYE